MPRALPTAAIVGVGGLGCPAAWALARAGVALRLLDEDVVDRSNLHRQILYGDGDVGRRKVEAAADALRAFAPVEPVAEHVSPERALALLADVDVVVEGSDNLPTKFLVADACQRAGVPVVHGACVGWRATVLPVAWRAGACYRCVFEDLPSPDEQAAVGDCATAGVFGPVTSVAGALMAAEALRLLRGDLSHAGVMARYEAWPQRFRATRLARRPGCPLCADDAPAAALDPARYVLACGAPAEALP